jgi:2-dehydro-3-deoxyphosphogluconate aldolase/(4S)-4-hydroxy-2-oxoglutarate aldolase
MEKAKLMLKLKEEKIVAVIRGNNEEEVLKIVDAVHKGGINFIEITFTVPHCELIIAKLAEKFKDDESIVIGAGTCLDIVSARMAILAGAEFVVCPHFDKEIVKLCNSYRIPVMPGATTVKDMLDCLRYGAEVIKLFPGDSFGPKAIKAFKGPLPQAEIMPTGGVSVENINEWIDNGAYAVGTGGSLTAGAKTGDFAAVTAEAEKFVAAVKSRG